MRSVQEAIAAVMNTATNNFRLLRSNRFCTGRGNDQLPGAYGDQSRRVCVS
jgi:hypothetical protein